MKATIKVTVNRPISSSTNAEYIIELNDIHVTAESSGEILEHLKMELLQFVASINNKIEGTTSSTLYEKWLCSRKQRKFATDLLEQLSMTLEEANEESLKKYHKTLPELTSTELFPVIGYLRSLRKIKSVD